MAWHRKLVAQKFDGSQQRQSPGRPKIAEELETLIVRIARENRSWGYDRIVGALANLGYTVSDQTVGDILKRHGIPPAPERKMTMTGVTPHPNEAWMVQVARNVTMEAWGFLSPGQYLIHDRDGKYCRAFQQLIDTARITRVPLPPQSPHLNAYAERWVRSVKQECLSRLILFGEAALYQALREYMAHYHHERNHQGKGNVLLCPAVSQATEGAGPIRCRERLGGLLKSYDREAA